MLNEITMYNIKIVNKSLKMRKSVNIMEIQIELYS
jgi:hypothetical protein